jgi:DNA-binding ferritin-like protein
MNEWQTSLITLLGCLRALKWLSWNGHWQVKGSQFYGDHLMLERIYEGKIDEQIDTLAEKMVCLFGSDIIDNPMLLQSFNNSVESCKSVSKCPIQRTLRCLQMLQAQFNHTYSIGTNTKQITLGMDDYLMATANEQETFIYLLQQRLR